MAGWLKIAIVLAGLIGLGGGFWWYGLPPKPQDQAAAPAAPAPQQPAPAAPAAPAPAQQQAAVPPAPAPAASAPAPQPPAAPAAQAEAAPMPPGFDVVRVEPTGDSVIAGRAAPGATVTLMLNGKPFASVTADAGGHFAFVPPAIPAGSHELTLTARTASGQDIASTQSIAVSVPAASGGDVIVALAQPGQPTQLLAKPSTVAAAPSAPAAASPPSGERARVALSTVEAEDGGRFHASGVAEPGATVRLYLNDSFLAAATASPQGGWSFTIGRGLTPGNYRVRVDDVEPAGGKVLSRAEVAFDYAPRVASAAPAPAGSAPAAGVSNGAGAPSGATAAAGGQVASASDVVLSEIRSTQVTRGDSLWRISKRIYGKGVRFTVIYEANQKQIRDPDRIYPGQVFVLPTDRS
ncbi:Ig-like domain-containing protein [Alsobacter sp. SYSU M60028]|uniref:Ig-like domain-containing protein n=1 Tax=Alsobacter ponti TaxID=2962936 RepID=A0ABT1LIL9_9HYPH|nr:LysM peptidoglycan-binding domain-containing protein [Alsobacter ponti]MCP8940068.1 Ig-like domain-containing protein [Alsobacter ponti]